MILYIYFTIFIFINFFSAPFTLQRLAEIIVNPRKHYSNVNKVCNGLEKVNFKLYSIEILYKKFKYII